MIYLASPYSHPDPLVMKTRFLLAQQATAAMIFEGKFVYSPIVHCHELAQAYQLPKDFDFWRRYNIDMLRRADAFRILKIPGWDESKGVCPEGDIAVALDLDRGFVDEFGRDIL